MTVVPDDDEMTELVDAQFNRVDLVGKGANGIPRFLIAKQDATAGVLDPGFIRDLIAKSEPEQSGRERVTMPTGVTLTGSPADIAAFIHKASDRDDDVAKAEMSAKAINDLPDSDFAYIESGGKKDADGKTVPRDLRHFPIPDKAHADNAAARIAQGAKFGKEALPKVEAAQRKFGEKVSKADATGPQIDDGVDGLDPTIPLAAPEDDDMPGDPADPGSPAWEAIDSATAQKWTSILARARVAVDMLSDREALEAASADPGDAGNAANLQDVCCAIDFAISVLAPYAVSEQSEADSGAMEAIGKAMTAMESVPLDRIEGLTAVAKAGRVLSTANENEIRSAAASLNKVLSSLPAAPQTDDSGQPVAKKEARMPRTDAADVTKADADDQAANTGPVDAGGTTGLGQPRVTGPDSSLPADGPQQALPGDVPGRVVVKAQIAAVFDQDGCLTGVCDPAAIVQRVGKAADGDAKPAMQAVFDQTGSLIGICDPSDITPVAGADGKKQDDDDTPADPAADDTAAAAAPAEGAPDPGDMNPQPSADAGTPAGDVAKETSTTTPDPQVLKSALAELVTEILSEREPAQGVAKQADVAAAREALEELAARIAKVEEQPARPKVFANGQVPAPHMLRGQDRGDAPVDVAKAAELRHALYNGSGPEQADAFHQLEGMAISKFAQIRSGAAQSPAAPR